MDKKRTILFLCTGNSCRSQMAEAIVNHRLGDKWQAVSAGTAPAGYTHPKAIQALAEIGIEHDGESKHTDAFRQTPLDLVVTVCEEAAKECPVWLGPGRRVHLGFPDPAAAVGSDEAIMTIFRQVRDDIARRVTDLLETEDRSLEGHGYVKYDSDRPRAG